MPELPEVTVYVEALERLVAGRVLLGIRLRSPSLLRTWDPPLSAVHGRRVVAFRRLGKRVVWEMEDDLFLVVHLMVTGRFQWRKPGAAVPRKRAHAGFDFEHGTLLLTEAGTKKKATLHVVRGEEGLASLDPGGLEPLEADLPAFAAALTRENRTLKRALTDPRILSGIGNAHSDEILLEAGLSPVQRTRNLSEEEVERLFQATRAGLTAWTARLRDEVGDGFPVKVTAFHPAMAAHGKFGEPCPRCGTAIQRIVYGERETNYCPACQTGGKLLADRALSRLLREDWPKTLEELEEMKEERRG
ncbi:MAG: formamidopyrimidine-DNA glycosylase [Gemmatimonadetes bacterium]|nr:formamidopyrimidine-DNA glycosylase [Gemmatimonadota bacterium]